MMLMVSTAMHPTVSSSKPRRWTRPIGIDWRIGLGVALLLIALSGGAALVFSQLRKGDRAVASVVPKPAAIDGNRAFGYLEQICKIGPRPAGSAANTRQRGIVAEHFRKMGATVREQPFTGVDPQSGERVRLVNVIGSWFPERMDRVLITAHYDTRPHPDQETDPARYRLPFIGANDCASGVATMMEIAHHLKELPTPLGVDLVLLDGEELVYDRTDEYFLGSKAFAKAYKADRRAGKIKYHYRAGILLDMAGGKGMSLRREPYSAKLAPRLVEEVWGVAQKLGEKSFQRGYGREVLDDHLALNDAGIPTVDLIDFDYPHWHLASDLPENCSAASLAEVGRVLTAWLCLPRK